MTECAPRAGEPLINARVNKSIENVKRHIREGCVSDPDPRDFAMHVITGRSEDGLMTFRSLRGTNSVENYHKRFKDAVSSYRVAPRLAHSVILAFNADWNIRMAGDTILCESRVLCRVGHVVFRFPQIFTAS